MKQALLEECGRMLQEQELKLKKHLESVQEARNNETKSTAGDKFETGRAMMQAEEAKLSEQLGRLLMEKAQLEQLIRKTDFSEMVEVGSLVICEDYSYFIGLSLGKISIEKQTIFCLSSKAPIASSLIAKRPGETFSFNGKSQKILNVL